MLMGKSRTGGRNRSLCILIKILEWALAGETRTCPRNPPFLSLPLFRNLDRSPSQITGDWYLILDMNRYEWCRGKALADVVSALSVFLCPFYLMAHQLKFHLGEFPSPKLSQLLILLSVTVRKFRSAEKLTLPGAATDKLLMWICV